MPRFAAARKMTSWAASPGEEIRLWTPDPAAGSHELLRRRAVDSQIVLRIINRTEHIKPLLTSPGTIHKCDPQTDADGHDFPCESLIPTD